MLRVAPLSNPPAVLGGPAMAQHGDPGLQMEVKDLKERLGCGHPPCQLNDQLPESFLSGRLPQGCAGKGSLAALSLTPSWYSAKATMVSLML